MEESGLPRSEPTTTRRARALHIESIILTHAAELRASKRPQAQLQNILERERIVNALAATLAKRLRSLDAPAAGDMHALRVLRGFKNIKDTLVVWNALRSFCEAWITSHRMGEDRTLPCRFGCNAEDRMRHYVVCPRLQLVISRSTAAPRFSADLEEFAAGTLPTASLRHRIRQWAVATMTSNTIRANHHDLACRARAEKRLPELGRTLRSVA